MLIDFDHPVLPVDAHSQRAFVEILNLILLSEDVKELSRHLMARDRAHRHLSGYFKWSYSGYSFTLWQRMAFGSDRCFKSKVLEIKHISLACQDRRPRPIIKN